MKYILPIFILFSTSLIAQTGESYDYNKNVKIKADSDPVYPSGENAMYELVYNKLEFPHEKINGESMINFDVNPDSTLSGFSIIKEVGYGIDQSIINIMKQLKFSPGTINGKPVVKNMVLSFPIETE